MLSQRYDIDLDADPFDFYRVLRQVNPSPYMYFLRHPDITIVGSSPEPMVQVLGRKVISRPIAGTRRRGRDDDHDRRRHDWRRRPDHGQRRRLADRGLVPMPLAEYQVVRKRVAALQTMQPVK